MLGAESLAKGLVSRCEPEAFTRTTAHKGGGLWLTYPVMDI